MSGTRDAQTLRNRIGGTVTTRNDSAYEDVRRQAVWNELKPARSPEMIVRVAAERDVVETVRFARTHGMKIAVRGGGHSWVGFSLRDDGVLIDLGDLREVSVDPQARTASIQPAVTGRELSRRLAEHGLAFPVGHCPTVPLSGFLLNGGLGWNSNRWRPACFSIRAAHVVTADGELVVANEAQNADLLWAIRGAGPGFFAVVTRYWLDLHTMPRAITTSTDYYPLARIGEVAAWAASIARRLPREAELTLSVAPSPPSLADVCRSSHGFVGILSATAFVDTAREAAATLGILDTCPLSPECLHKRRNESTPMETLLDRGGASWPEHHRYLADTLWSASPAADLMAVVREHFLRAPSRESLAALVCPTGARGSGDRRLDAAFSMTADLLLLSYAIWKRPEDDAANFRWHDELTRDLEPFALGHYIGETDIVTRPTRAARSFEDANWQRLQSLRRTYDPDGLFHGHF